MRIDPSSLDAEFMMVDADAPLGDVLDLVGDLSPDHVVIRDSDEDEDLFYILEPEELTAWDAGEAGDVAQVIETSRMAPAAVVAAAAAVATGLAQPGPTVVLTDGIPDGLVPAEPVRRGSRRGRGSDRPGGRGGGAEAGNGGDDDQDRPLALAVDYAKAVSLGTTLSLLIRLTDVLTGPDVLPFVAATGDVIDVFVSPRSGFVVDGAPDGRLEVTAGTEPLPVQVKVRATETGVGSLTIYAFRDGEALGALTIAPTVVPAETLPSAGQGSARTALRDAATPLEADLQFVILQERDEHNQPLLRFLLTSRDPGLGLNLKPFGPTPLEGGPGGYFTDLYRQIEKLPVKTEEDKADANERLRAIGSTLFAQLIPDDLQTLLWELREQISTVWVQSAEPYVPWELCRLQGRGADGAIVEGEFFCEAFALTRWIPGIARLPELKLTNLGVVVPSDSGLVNAPAEKDMLHGLARAGRTVADIPARYREVRAALASADYDCLHFSGHGAFPDPSNPAKAEIELEGARKLRPSDISGVAANLGLRRPLVFLNACQVGQQAPGLTGVGGWATALLGNGAAAFVGAHWEVTDDLALRFATRFYAELVAGAPVAEAARNARIAIRDEGDPTWLAYTVFADPGARLAVA